MTVISDSHDLAAWVSSTSDALERHVYQALCPVPPSYRIDINTVRSLRQDLLTTPHGLFVRALFQFLGADEQSPMRFGLENKLLQALLFNHYRPNTFPVTVPLAFLYGSGVDSAAPKFARAFFPNGCIVKPIYGSSSQRDQVLSRSQAWVRSGAGLRDEFSERPHDYLLQEEVELAKEHRVHTLSEFVVPALTYTKLNLDESTAETDRNAIHAFVASVVAAMPASTFHNTFCAWDVAEDKRGHFQVIEINFSGYHTHDGVGFHCSGSLQDPFWGAFYVASLLDFVGQTYECETLLPRLNGTLGDTATDACYREIRAWQNILRLQATLVCLEDIREDWRSIPNQELLFARLSLSHNAFSRLYGWLSR